MTSSATWPPAASTALRSAAGTFHRPSSRPKNATVSVSGSTAFIASATMSTSVSFQRSTPSTITKRRPSANVIAVSARGHRVGRASVALEQLDAADAALLLGHGAQPGPPLGDAAVVVAADEIGGAEGGHAG